MCIPDGNNMETTWGQYEALYLETTIWTHRDVETTCGQCGDYLGTTGMCPPHGDNYGDNMGITGMWRPCGDNIETLTMLTT